MTAFSVWTLTVDEGGNDSVVTTVHPSEVAALQALRDNYCDGVDLPLDDSELVDFLTKPSWEGGPGVVFSIEEHDLDIPPASFIPAPTADPLAAITEIRALAHANDLAVSIVTISDVLMLKGIDAEPESVHREAVLESWEWRHFGDNWSDWFDGLSLDADTP